MEKQQANRYLGILSWMVVFLYVAELLLMTNINIFRIYSKSAVTLLIVSFLLFVLLALGKIKQEQINFPLIMIAYDFFAVVINHGGVGSIMIQIYIIAVIIVISNITFTISRLKCLLAVDMVLWLFWFLQAKDYYLKFNNSNGTMMNSNTIAEIILFCYMVFCIVGRRIYIKKIGKKLFMSIFTIATAWILWQCRSRTTLVVFLFFLVLCRLPHKIWKKRRLLLITGVIMLGGVIFPLVYLSWANNITLQNWVYHITGRTLYTGREIIWGNFKEGFDSIISWLVGQGSKTKSSTVVSQWGSNLHNTYLLILMNFGILGLMLYMLYMIKNVYIIIKKEKGRISEFQIESIFMFWCFLLLGWLETSLLWNPLIPLCYFAVAIGQNESLQKLLSVNK